MAGDMASDDEDLVTMARNGEMDYSKWPAMLERVVPRLEHIVYNEFPLASSPLPGSLFELKKEDSSATKREFTERDEPPEKRVKREKDGAANVSTEENGRPIPQATDTLDPAKGTLPPLLLTLLQTIIATLRTSFPTSPPYTSQRLAELLLTPRKHYQTLPSYLRALDRIVSVASPASIFPLKNLSASATGTNGAILNGISSPSPDPADDEDFIGGAELTEIPWAPKPQPVETTAEAPQATMSGAPANASDLRTESTSMVEGPNGLGGVETVTVANGVSSSAATQRESASASSNADSAATAGTSPPQHGITQGELLRQEQEAGIVPVPSPVHSSQGGNNSRITRSSAAAASQAVGADPSESDHGPGQDAPVAEAPTPEEEVVHARGPSVIGMEDMGPQAPFSGLQGGLDVEGALGRRGEIITPSEDADLDADTSQSTGATQELDSMDLKGEDVVMEKSEGEEDATTKLVGKPGERDETMRDADGDPVGGEQSADNGSHEEGSGAVDTAGL